jgi:HEAT repeat protein
MYASKSNVVIVFISVLLAGSVMTSSPVHAQDTTLQQRVEEIVGLFPAFDSSRRDQAAEAIIQLGPRGILTVCRMLASPGERDDASTRFALHGITMLVNREGKQRERSLYSRSLIRALEEMTDPEVKAFLIRQVQLVGGNEAVKPLSRYLKNDRLCDPAAQALLAIGTLQAEEALLKALHAASGGRRITLIRGLGELRSAPAVPEILPFADSSEGELRQVSLFALANIGDPAAEDILTRFTLLASRYDRQSAPSLLLLYTRRLGEGGRKKATARLCHQLIAYYTAPGESQVPCTALTILVDTLGETALGDLLRAMDHPLKAVRARALELSHAMPGPAVTSVWTRELGRRSAEVRAEIISMLGKRGDLKALQPIREELTSPDPEVRMEAVTAAALLGGPEILPDIWPLLDKSDEAETANLQKALLGFPSTQVVPEAAARLEGASPQAQVALIEILAERQAREFAPRVLTLARSENSAVRKSALAALEKLAQAEHMEQVLDLLLEIERRSEIPLAHNALVAAALSFPEIEDRAADILARYETCTPERKPDLLRPLARIGGEAALSLVIQELDNPTTRIRSAAVYALAQWPEIQAAEPLMVLCRSTTDRKILYPALQGYVRLIREADIPLERKASELEKTLELPLGNQEKNLILDGLSRVKTTSSLRLAAGFLEDPEVRFRAARSIQRIALPEAGADGLWDGEVLVLLRQAQPLIEDEHERRRIESYITTGMEADGFVSLFNGTDLSGWIGDTKGYTVEEGRIVIHPSKGSGNLYTVQEYRDFIFRFEFKLTPGANNGLGIRTPPEGDAAYVGMELQILDNSAEQYRDLEPYQYHGSVYGVVPALRGYQRPVGEWNYQEVTVRGRRVTVSLNGTVIVDADLDEASASGTMDGREHPGLKREQGHIGFLGHGSRVEFRSLWIRELK